MMHNWLEMYMLGQERTSEARRRTAALILEKGEVLSLRLSGRSLRVACVAGRLWATVDRSPTDHLLAPGEAQTFRGRGAVVIQALRTATARIELIARLTGLAGRELRLALEASTYRLPPGTH